MKSSHLFKPATVAALLCSGTFAFDAQADDSEILPARMLAQNTAAGSPPPGFECPSGWTCTPGPQIPKPPKAKKEKRTNSCGGTDCQRYIFGGGRSSRGNGGGGDGGGDDD